MILHDSAAMRRFSTADAAGRVIPFAPLPFEKK
jgi:hypothetical protein